MDWLSFGLQSFNLLISPALLLLLGWLGTKLSIWIGSKVKNEQLAGVLIRASDAVLQAVKYVQQVVVSEIKRANEDGVISPEERAAIKAAALGAVKDYLGKTGLAELQRVLGLTPDGVERFLSDRIEAAVHDVKAPVPQ
jgi:hypothetical protein